MKIYVAIVLTLHMEQNVLPLHDRQHEHKSGKRSTIPFVK